MLSALLTETLTGTTNLMNMVLKMTVTSCVEYLTGVCFSKDWEPQMVWLKKKSQKKKKKLNYHFSDWQQVKNIFHVFLENPIV